MLDMCKGMYARRRMCCDESMRQASDKRRGEPSPVPGESAERAKMPTTPSVGEYRAVAASPLLRSRVFSALSSRECFSVLRLSFLRRRDQPQVSDLMWIQCGYNVDTGGFEASEGLQASSALRFAATLALCIASAWTHHGVLFRMHSRNTPAREGQARANFRQRRPPIHPRSRSSGVRQGPPHEPRGGGGAADLLLLVFDRLVAAESLRDRRVPTSARGTVRPSPVTGGNTDMRPP